MIDTVVIADFRYVFIWPFADTGDLRALGRLHPDDLDGRVLFLEIARTAHDGTGSPHAGNEVGDPALRVAPDFRAGGAVMCGGIVGVGKLVEDLAYALFLHRKRQIARTFHAGFPAHQLQFGAKGAHRLLTLDRGIFGHEQDELVAAHGRRHRQRDAGIAAGRLDQRIAGFDLAAHLRGVDHRQRRTVLHRAGRIVALELDEKRVARLARHALEAHQRRIADAVFDGLVRIHAFNRCSVQRTVPSSVPQKTASYSVPVSAERPSLVQ